MLKVVKVGCRFHCANHTCQNLMGLAADVRTYVCIYLMPSALLVASYRGHSRSLCSCITLQWTNGERSETARIRISLRNRAAFTW